MSKSKSGGYTVKNLDLLDAKYRCLICSDLLKDPVQLDCGHRICQTCSQTKNKIFRCVLCEEDTILSEVKLDKGFQRDMQILQVNCNFCEWIGSLQNYHDHLEKLHQQFECSYCGEIFHSVLSMEQHEEKLCTKKLVDCTLHSYGCREQILRSDLDKHYRTEEHQRNMLSCITELRSQLIQRDQTSSVTNDHMRMETSDLPLPVGTMSSSTIEVDENNNELEHLSMTTDLFSRSICTLKDELICLRSDASQQSKSLETIDTLLSMMKSSNEESENVLRAMNTNLLILQQDFLSVKLKFEDQQILSYDGTLVWKISQFQEKMTNAKSERQTSIYSPPFRSSPTGYQMRARLYLFGDGNARRTHMSLFFVLMRGPHDCILEFPFTYKVTFCLFDQTFQNKHIIDSFRPDIKSNSFQRPRSDMNIASGIPKFVSLSIFENSDNPYVRDDTMFIKVMVDFGNLSKTVLPYALTLNPGLPMHIQHEMIQQEIERKAPRTQIDGQATLGNNEDKAAKNKN